jgi:hypothetical protein
MVYMPCMMQWHPVASSATPPPLMVIPQSRAIFCDP